MNRDITGGSSPVLLDATDDTNNSAADFDALSLAGPRNNAGGVSRVGQASVSGGVLTVNTAAGTASDFDVTRNGAFYNVRDLLAAGRCRLWMHPVEGQRGALLGRPDHDHQRRRRRPGRPGERSATPLMALVGGNTGNDELISKNGDVTFDGGAGNDTIQPGKGADYHRGRHRRGHGDLRGPRDRGGGDC